MYKIFAVIALVSWSALLFGQRRPPGVGGSSPTPTQTSDNGTGLFNRSSVKSDTFEANYFYKDNPYVISDIQDTLLSANFIQADPAFKGDYAYANLGNLGSAARPLVYQMQRRAGFRAGFNLFDIYKLNKEALPFFRLKTAFSDAGFHQGRTQDDHLLNVIFAQEFGKGLSFTMHHQRINHQGVFQNQNVQHIGLNTGMWYHHPNGKYQAFITFTSNRHQQNENGGFDAAQANDSNTSTELEFPIVFEGSTNPLTHHQKRALTLTHYYQLTKTIKPVTKDSSNLLQFPLIPRDSIGQQKKRPVTSSDSLGQIKKTPKEKSVIEKDSIPQIAIDSLIKDSIAIDSIAIDSLIPDSLRTDSVGLLKKGRRLVPPSASDSLQRNEAEKVVIYYDPNYLHPKQRKFGIGHELNIYSGFYKYSDSNPAADSSFYKHLQIYNQELQYLIKQRGIVNKFFLFTSSIKEESEKSNQQPRDFLKAGIRQESISISRLGRVGTINNLNIFGELNYQPIGGIRLDAEAGFYFLGDNIGDYYLKGNLSLGVKKIGNLNIQVEQQTYSPAMVEEYMEISSLPLWENNFNKTIESRIGGNLQIDWSKTQVGFQLNLLDNYIYYDTLAYPQQFDEVVAIPQFIIHQPLRNSWLDFENTLVFQSSNTTVLPLPSIFTKHSLAVKFRLFRAKREFWLGAQSIFHLDYRARSYQPLTGQFYNSKEELKYYPQIDPFLGLQVSDFRIYVKVQNVLGFINPEIAFRTPDYPIPYRIIRFGVKWRMLN